MKIIIKRKKHKKGETKKQQKEAMSKTTTVQPILKSEHNKQNHKLLVLQNSLPVLLIQDPQAQKSAAAMVSHVGSASDPLTHQGLAHLLEHMLFMGSKKYPDESEYIRYMSLNGGEANAYTGEFSTNFHFQCSTEAFLGGLDRFAQFFISPLFKQECVVKELNNVHSEFLMNMTKDGWRRHHLLKSLSDQRSPNAKFSIGNFQTLMKPNLLARLTRLYQEAYSANTMALVVCSSLEMEVLEQQVTNIFSQVENKQRQYKGFSKAIQPYNNENLGKLVKLVPLKNLTQLTIRWVFSSDLLKGDEHILNYFAHILGHEGSGSAFDILQKSGLAHRLMAQPKNNEDFFGEMMVEIDLTEEGLDRWKDVLEVIGDSISKIRQGGVQKWIFDECQSIATLDYHFPARKKEIDLCSSLAEELVWAVHKKRDLRKFLKARSSFGSFKPALLLELANYMVIENAHVVLTGKRFSGDCGMVEPIFRTNYAVSELSEDVLSGFGEPDLSWVEGGDGVKIPEKNALIPRVFKIVPKDASSCQKMAKILETEFSEIWHFQGQGLFETPKIFINLQIYHNNETSQLYFTDPKHIMLKFLWNKIFDSFRNRDDYYAQLARCEFTLSATHQFMGLSGNCFSDSFKKYLEMLKKQLTDFRQFSDEKVFILEKSRLMAAVNGAMHDVPFRRGFQMMNKLLTDRNISNEDCLLGASSITYENFLAYNSTIFSLAKLEWVVQGNISALETKKICKKFEENFVEIFNSSPLPRDLVNHQKVVDLNPGQVHVVEKKILIREEINSCFTKVYQIGEDFDENFASSEILTKWLRPSYFAELRTRQQVGYLIFASAIQVRGVYFFIFNVQSHNKSTDLCRRKTLDFLARSFRALIDMPEEEFETIRAGCLSDLVEPGTPAELFQENSIEVVEHSYMFDKREKKREMLLRITKDDVVKAYQRIFLDKPKIVEMHQYCPESRSQGVRDRMKRARSLRGSLIYHKKDSEFAGSQRLFEVDQFA